MRKAPDLKVVNSSKPPPSYLRTALTTGLPVFLLTILSVLVVENLSPISRVPEASGRGTPATLVQQSKEAPRPSPSRVASISDSDKGSSKLVQQSKEPPRPSPGRVVGITDNNKTPATLAQTDNGASRPLTVRVARVTDGDSITVITSAGEQIPVRLVEIDAPEWDQPGGANAKAALSKLISGRDVEIRATDTDQYGRLLARVYSAGTDVNAAMVRDGYAWAYRDYLVDRSLLAIEAEARSAKRGLWAISSSETIPPWEWRRGQRLARPTARPPSVSVPPPVPNSERQCLGKRFCRQMTSCEEARFYLNVCRVDTIDGDGDGIPCEAICGH
jgi:endonuclease YncB( thermonuclease family)